MCSHSASCLRPASEPEHLRDWLAVPSPICFHVLREFTSCRRNPPGPDRSFASCFRGHLAGFAPETGIPPPIDRSQRAVLHPFLLRFLPPFALWSIVTGSFIPFAPVFFQKQLGISLQHVGLIFSASQFAQFCAVLIAPLLFRGAGSIARIIGAQLVAGGAAIRTRP